MEDEERDEKKRTRKKIYTIQSENNSSVKRKAYFVGRGRGEDSGALLFNQLGCSKLEWRWETTTLSTYETVQKETSLQINDCE